MDFSAIDFLFWGVTTKLKMYLYKPVKLETSHTQVRNKENRHVSKSDYLREKHPGLNPKKIFSTKF